MRHRVYGRQLNRDSEHRIAMLRNLAAGLFEHGEIETTMPKAKAVQPFVERIITVAKRGTFTARRQIEAKLNDRNVFGWLTDPSVPDRHKDSEYFELPDQSEIQRNRYGEIRKAPRLVQHIMTQVAPLFADRDGGYTRIIKTGRHRLGDGADLVILQLVGQEDGAAGGGGQSRRREQADRRAAFAAKLRKGAGGGETAAAAAAADEAAPPAEADDQTSEAVTETETATAVAEPATDATPAPEAETAADAEPDATDAAAPDEATDSAEEEQKP